MKKITRSIWLHEELWNQITSVAKSERRTASNFILLLLELGLEAWLKKHPEQSNEGAA